MLESLKKILGFGPGTDYAQLLRDGAVIIDVRTEQEFRGGHVPGSVNIPLDKLKGSVNKIKNKGPVIVCCASGMRSASAKSILQGKGFTEVYNAGSWYKLRKYAR